MSPAARLAKIYRDGAITARLLYSIAKLGVPDLLKDGPKTSDEVARQVGANPDAMHRVMRALTHQGVFNRHGEAFGLTDMGNAIRTDAPDSVRYHILMAGEFWYKSYGQILHTVKTGEPCFDETYGKRFFDHVKDDTDMAFVWDRAMSQQTTKSVDTLATAYDFSRFKKIMDVAGGLGTYLAAVLKANPKVQGVLFEMPHVADRARAYLASQGVSDRCEVVTGSFFESVPEGCDAYIMKAILHDWDDDECIQIMKVIRRAIPKHGVFIDVARLIRDETDDAVIDATMADILLMTQFRGRERTEAEFRRIFDASGFNLKNITPAGHHHILEVVPV